MNLLFDIKINSYPIIFVFWNIFLALLPCFIAWLTYKIFKNKRWSKTKWYQKLLFPLLFISWFFFFPNTAYLFTVVRHLIDHCINYDPILRVCRRETWMIMFFFVYALIGVPTFIYALKKMSSVLGTLFHKTIAIVFPAIMIPLTAMGVLLGLIERFNTWNIVHDPLIIVRTGLGYFIDPDMIWNFIAYTVLLYFIYYSMTLIIKYLKNN